MSKYGNQKTYADGIIFDSKKEANRYLELKLMEKAHLIKDIRLQPKYQLIPEIKGPKGGLIQRPIYYVADFEYYEKKGNDWLRVVEDVKGMRTEVYKLKKKLFRWKYGIEIKEV